MPWSGWRHTPVAHLACASTIGHSRLRQALAAARVQQDRVERGAEDVVLLLVEGAVAEPYRVGPGVPRELVARGLRQVTAPVDPVHDLKAAVLVRLEVGHELHELVGLPVEVQEVERLKRERRVADPREAVVPVALAAGRLGEGGRGRRHRRAGRHVGQALDRERRALDRVAPAVVREPGSARASGASTGPSPRGARSPRRCPVARRAPRPRRARSRPGRPAPAGDVPARGRPRSPARGRSEA